MSYVSSCVFFCSSVSGSGSVSPPPTLVLLPRGAPSLIQGLDALSNITPHVELRSQMRVDLDTQTRTQTQTHSHRHRHTVTDTNTQSQTQTHSHARTNTPTALCIYAWKQICQNPNDLAPKKKP